MLRRAAVLLALAAVVVPGTAQAETLTIQVTSVVVKVTSIDKNPKGTSAGDRVIQRNKLLNTVRQFGKAKGTHVGSDQGTVTFTSAHTERYDGVARLPGGQPQGEGRGEADPRRRHPDPGRRRYGPVQVRDRDAVRLGGRKPRPERLSDHPAGQRRLTPPRSTPCVA